MKNLLFLLALAACDNSWTVKGTTLPGAVVTVDCGTPPATNTYGSVTARADGTFDTGEIGYLQKDCTVHVAKDGYAPADYPVTKVCTQWHGDNCGMVVVNAPLTASH
jgi:hypothetical protein